MRRLLFGAASLTLALLLAPTTGHAQTQLRVALSAPMQSHLGDNLISFKDLVEVISNGQLQVDIFPDDMLAEDQEVIDAVASGEIEMGVVPLTLVAQKVPIADVFQLPFAFPNDSTVRDAASETSPVRRAIDSRLLESGARVLWWQPGSDLVFLSNGEPIRRPEDLAGKRVRAFGPLYESWIEMVGGTPVRTSSAGQEAAYRDGDIEVGVTTIVETQTRRLDQIMDTVTALDHTSLEYVVLINADLWDGLTPELHQLLTESVLRVERVLRGEILRAESDAYAYVEAGGMEIYRPNAEELAAWQASSEPLREIYLEKTGPAGQEILDRLREVADPRSSATPAPTGSTIPFPAGG